MPDAKSTPCRMRTAFVRRLHSCAATGKKEEPLLGVPHAAGPSSGPLFNMPVRLGRAALRVFGSEAPRFGRLGSEVESQKKPRQGEARQSLNCSPLDFQKSKKAKSTNPRCKRVKISRSKIFNDLIKSQKACVELWKNKILRPGAILTCLWFCISLIVFGRCFWTHGNQVAAAEQPLWLVQRLHPPAWRFGEPDATSLKNAASQNPMRRKVHVEKNPVGASVLFPLCQRRRKMREATAVKNASSQAPSETRPHNRGKHEIFKNGRCTSTPRPDSPTLAC
ncbi:hypothetical protein M885DRAFT_503711 [Pelagophyceae sp. CCMP2097]|nr:hypothetical protein M885DRAFT_503711 [Pelagophyceae sp. CCMP2097]